MDADLVAAAAAVIGLFVALYTTLRTLKDGTRARDFASVQSILQNQKESSTTLFEKNKDPCLTDEDYDFYAAHFLDNLEFAAYVVRNDLTSEEAKNFLAGWLKNEAADIAGSSYLRKMVKTNKVSDLTYSEFRAFCKEHQIKLDGVKIL